MSRWSAPRRPRRLRATEWGIVSQSQADVAILGGGPGGYEAALVAAQLGARGTVVEADGLGGARGLADRGPAKTPIAPSETMGPPPPSPDPGIRIEGYDGRMTRSPGSVTVDAPRLYGRIKALARAQSADVAARLAAEGVEVIASRGRLTGPHTVLAGDREISAGVVLLATGGLPRQLPGAEPDGERILNWRHLYDLTELPSELIVVGSGVTGAEFASAYQALGSQVTLISSRDRVLPHEDTDAAMVVEDVFSRRGMTVLSRSRAAGVKPEGRGVAVTLTDGRTVRGSHCLLTVEVVPATGGLGLDQAGVKVDDRGFVIADKVSRTSAPGVYAA